jgi:hypothetical protein
MHEHTRTWVYIKVCTAYHFFTDQLTLAGDRKLATKTEAREVRGTMTVVTTTEEAGNGKFRTLFIPVHLVSSSTLKTTMCEEVCVRATRSDEPGSTQATCLSVAHVAPSQTRAYVPTRTTGSLCFEQLPARPHLRPAARITTTPHVN